MNQIIIYIALTLAGLSGSVQAVELDKISDNAYCYSVEAEADQNSKDDKKIDSIAFASQVLSFST